MKSETERLCIEAQAATQMALEFAITMRKLEKHGRLGGRRFTAQEAIETCCGVAQQLNLKAQLALAMERAG